MRKKQATGGDPAVAVAYVRVSTEDQNLGPEAQRAAIQAWALRAGVRVAAVFEDRVGGATPADARPGLLAALAALREHGAGVLVAAKRDRLARDVVVCVTIETLAADAGAKVVTADGVSADATPEGQLMRTLLDAFAQYERALIKCRTKAALAVKKGRGEKTGGAVPFGSKLAEDGIHLAPIAAEQAAIRAARALRAAGHSLRAIGRELERQGHLPRSGRPWDSAQVLRMVAA
jgi:site-specific DNA recombinase